MPKVTVIEPTKTPLQKPKAERRLCDTERLLLPTALEIEEGQAAKAFVQNPSVENAARFQALNRKLWQIGVPPTTRCPWCYTLRYGRPLTAPCAVCGTTREIGEGYSNEFLTTLDRG